MAWTDIPESEALKDQSARLYRLLAETDVNDLSLRDLDWIEAMIALRPAWVKNACRKLGIAMPPGLPPVQTPAKRPKPGRKVLPKTKTDNFRKKAKASTKREEAA